MAEILKKAPDTFCLGNIVLKICWHSQLTSGCKIINNEDYLGLNPKRECPNVQKAVKCKR